MPTFPTKSGPKFSMNAQVGKSMYGDSAPPDDGMPDASADDHVELHKGGNPQGQPPPHEGTQYHTIHTAPPPAPPDIRNHDDYQSADQHMQECMGEGGMDSMGDMSGMDMGDDGGTD